MSNSNFIEKIKNRVVKNLKVNEVYPNTSLNIETIKYLKKQVKITGILFVYLINSSKKSFSSILRQFYTFF